MSVNRVIKFRAWVIQDYSIIKKGIVKRMVYDIELTTSDGSYFPDPKDGWAGECFDTQDDEVVFMQFTGLQDCNGKDIYEGDWCRAEFRDQDGIQTIQGKIIMDEYMWSIDYTGCVGDDIFSINRPYSFEIIGNIYENPELNGTQE